MKQHIQGKTHHILPLYHNKPEGLLKVCFPFLLNDPPEMVHRSARDAYTVKKRNRKKISSRLAWIGLCRAK